MDSQLEEDAAARVGSNGDAGTSQQHAAENVVGPVEERGSAANGLTVRVHPTEPDQEAAGPSAEPGAQPTEGISMGTAAAAARVDDAQQGAVNESSSLSDAMGSTRTAQLASLAEQADLRCAQNIPEVKTLLLKLLLAGSSFLGLVRASV